MIRTKKGLTLIELIAVLVILGIIAAIAVPTIGNTINTQRERAAELEWTAIETAARLYIAENATVTEFSMDDLYNGDYISENVVLEEDDAGTVIASSEDLFLNDSGSLDIDTTISAEIYIDGFLVYP